jgi:hypothetical protein
MPMSWVAFLESIHLSLRIWSRCLKKNCQSSVWAMGSGACGVEEWLAGE